MQHQKQLDYKLGLTRLLVIIGTILNQSAFAQLTPDHTLGTENSIVKQIDSFKDRIEGGATRGSNLFHSFQEFNIDAGKSVYFANPIGIENILTRVTGGNVSNILGTLGVEGTANLFFINPSGIFFGTGANLDIRGSFTATTADSIKLGENGLFSAANPQSSNLLSVQPGALFVNAMRNQVSEIKNEANLKVGKNLIFDADDINISGNLQSGNNLTLQANNELNIRDNITEPFIATAGNNLLIQGNQLVDIFALNHPNSGLFSGGNMVLRSANTVSGDAHYWSGGSFRIEKLDGSLGNLNSPHDPVIKANGDVSLQAYEGASLHIWATGKVEIPEYVWIQNADTVNGLAEIVSLSDGTSVAINGKIEPTLDIRAGLTLAGLGTPTTITTNGTFYGLDNSFSLSSADINLGTILFVNSAFTTILPGKVLLTNQYQTNSSLTGNITVTDTTGYEAILMGGNTGTRLVTLDSQNSINLNGNVSVSSPNGIGGNITLLANNNIITRSMNASAGGNGGSGNITLTSKNGEITLSNVSILNNNYGVIKGGDINITGRSLFVTNATILAATTFSQGNAGTIKIIATDSVKFDVNSFAESAVGTGAAGTAGGVDISTQSLELLGASYLSASTLGKGDAGTIKITAHSVKFDGNSSADSTVRKGALGKAKGMDISTQSLELLGGSYLSASTSGQGDAGTIKITANSVKLNGDSSVASQVALGAVGTAGGMDISTQSLELLGGSYLSASTLGKGDAGTIKITAHSVKLDGDSSVGSAVQTGGVGIAGGLDISTKSLEILGGSLLTTSTSGKGDAGTVKIIATDFVKFDNQSVAESVVGKGAVGKAGGVDISTQFLELLGGSRLDASTFGQGDAGTIKIIATNTIKFDNQSVSQSVVGQGAVGIAGGVDISTQFLELMGGSYITASTLGQGDAGTVKITATDSVKFDRQSAIQSAVIKGAVGKAGGVDISTKSLELLDASFLSASTFGQGDAGTIKITATDSVKFDGESAAQTTVQPGAIGKAGGVDISTQSLELRGGSILSASTYGQGDAGSVNITANTLTATTGGQVLTTTSSRTKAGNINLKIRDNITLDGTDTGLFANTEKGSTGDSGNIIIDPAIFIIKNGAGIGVNSQGSGKGADRGTRRRKSLCSKRYRMWEQKKISNK